MTIQPVVWLTNQPSKKPVGCVLVAAAPDVVEAAEFRFRVAWNVATDGVPKADKANMHVSIVASVETRRSSRRGSRDNETLREVRWSPMSPSYFLPDLIPA